jgi:hypothetical protein
LGTPLDTATWFGRGRIARSGPCCPGHSHVWQARSGETREVGDVGVVEAMAFYNLPLAMVLVYAGIRLELRSALLWRRSFCIWASAYGAFESLVLLAENYQGL